MTPSVCQVIVRTVLNSGGGPAAEAEVRLTDGSAGRGSAPAAIKPGAREARHSVGLAVGMPLPDAVALEVDCLTQLDATDQVAVDEWLAERVDRLGTDVTLALSLAYARAAAQSAGVSLTRHIARLVESRPAFPGLLTAAISGGIHGGGDLPFQQIMLATAAGPPSRVIPSVMGVYRRIEQVLFEGGMALGYSASSGIVPQSCDAWTALDVVSQAIADMDATGHIRIAVDVAAEHLHDGGGYHLDGAQVDARDLARRIGRLIDRYPMAMIEDPFVAADRSAWAQLTKQFRNRVVIVGDDLFASSVRYLDPALAHGVLLKMNQVGTLTDTIRTAARARASGMVCVVSHRSLETEDTALCDLSVALGARWIKVGGPRRGDRVAKYNQLLRLEQCARGRGGCLMEGAEMAWDSDDQR